MVDTRKYTNLVEALGNDFKSLREGFKTQIEYHSTYDTDFENFINGFIKNYRDDIVKMFDELSLDMFDIGVVIADMFLGHANNQEHISVNSFSKVSNNVLKSMRNFPEKVFEGVKHE